MISIKRLASALLLALCFSSYSNAQQIDPTTGAVIHDTGNLVTNVRGTSGHDVWLGTGAAADLGGVHPINVYGCCTSISGSSPLLDTSTLNGNGQSGQIIWSYGNATANYIVNTANALSGLGSTGLRVHGYTWGYELRNMNGDDRQGSIDTLVATSRLWNSTYTGGGLAFESRTHNTKMEWTRFDSTVTLASPQNISNVGNLQLSFNSSDSGFWAGYYGPQIRNIQARLLYSVDPCVTDPQSSPSCPGFKTYYNISDDGYALVPLPFTFPFYGENFTSSYFQSNGVISFSPGWGFCCSGSNLQSEGANSAWNYTLLPLAVDLIASDPSSRFYTQSNSSYMRYTWENINQFGTSNLNTFSVEIRPTGYIGFQYDNVNLQNNVVTSGIAGDIAQGQYNQIYHGSGNTFNLTGTYTFTGTEIDQCYIDPLSSITCIGYQQAFYDQQCSQDPLYDSGCPGYYQANYDLQCTINPLYDSGCPGYAEAYFTQQCSLNPLYNQSCPGYAQAYFDNQCSLNTLYNAQCPGYAEAKALKDLQEQLSAQNEPATESTNSVIISTPNATSSSSATVALADPTRTETVVTTDVGGVELTTSGEISIPTGQPTATKEAIKESAKEEEKKQEAKKEDTGKKRVDPRALAVARSAAREAEATALSTAEAAVTFSQSDMATSAALGLGTGITVGGFRPLGVGDNEEDNKSSQNSSSNKDSNLNLRNNSGNQVQQQENTQKAGLGVRRGGVVEGMEGGPDPAQLANAPLDFNQYLNAQLKDAQFYQSKEIYKGQRNVDNQRLLRGLSGGSDRLHQQMIDQQYNITGQ